MESFEVVEASIATLKHALDTGKITSVELVCIYLMRIGAYDMNGPRLNSFTVFNPNVLEEARESDERRAAGLPIRPLEGIPYTLKDGYKYKGMTVAAGSPAFEHLMPNSDAFVAEKLREAGAVLIGKTNMPPLAAGGMQRGLYGRAESPYNLDYLTAAFSSGSSNGAATSTAASFAAFGLGTETVSSGRSPASNNGLVAYTPSRGVISCRGVWPLYATCDVLVPLTRSISDLLALLPVLSEHDAQGKGDFWREQPFIKLPSPTFDWSSIKPESLKGKRIGVPRMYVGGKDGKTAFVSSGVMKLWEEARTDLEAMGAEVILTSFPLVTNYEDDSVSGQANNVVGAPANWNECERGILITKVWDKFLKENGAATGLSEVDGEKLFPVPFAGETAKFVEKKNLIDYPGLVNMSKEPNTLWEVPGMKQALESLEAQRKRDFEDWLDRENIDFVVFPAAGDVGRADLEENPESAAHAMQNGVKYSNGNRAIRHLGVPTVNVSVGTLEIGMPVNLTFAGKAYSDDKLISYAYGFEQKRQRRIAPQSLPNLTGKFQGGKYDGSKMRAYFSKGALYGSGEVDIYVNGGRIEVEKDGAGWKACIGPLDSSPLPQGRLVKAKTMILVVGRHADGHADAELFLA